MIDSNGFRFNVGIILTNENNQVFWAKRIGQDAWQFPQGGIQPHETPEQALYRELYEELGLSSDDVDILGVTSDWLYYLLPQHLIRYRSQPVCIGQKQKWFLLKLCCDPKKIRLDLGQPPEFDNWRWVNYWFPPTQVVNFKRPVYKKALQLLAPLLTRVADPACSE